VLFFFFTVFIVENINSQRWMDPKYDLAWIAELFNNGNSVFMHANFQKLEVIRRMLFCTSKFLVPSAVIAG